MPNWLIGKPAVLTIVSPLNSNTLNEAGATGGSAAGKAEAHKQYKHIYTSFKTEPYAMM